MDRIHKGEEFQFDYQSCDCMDYSIGMNDLLSRQKKSQLSISFKKILNSYICVSVDIDTINNSEGNQFVNSHNSQILENKQYLMT